MLHLPTFFFFFFLVWWIPGSVIDLLQHPWIHLHLLHLSSWVRAIWRLWAQVQIQLINGGASNQWVSTLSNFWMRHQNTWERMQVVKKKKKCTTAFWPLSSCVFETKDICRVAFLLQVCSTSNILLTIIE